MRKTFIQTLCELASEDPRIVLLTGDLGYLALEPFIEAFPTRFFNAGVAEQNMMGVATGLADAGFIPYVYSIVPFVSLRTYEFIRNGPIHHRLPVRIVGVGGGFEYATNGITHYGLEDIGVMRVQPGIAVIAPADAQQTRNCFRAMNGFLGPVYFRLGKDENRVVKGLEGRFAIDSVQIVRDGKDILLLGMGSIAADLPGIAETLSEQGCSSTIGIVSCFSPAPQQALAGLLRNFRAVVTVEAHFINGGLGSLVAEVIAENRIPCRLKRCGVTRQPDGTTGDQDFMHSQHNLSPKAIVNSCAELLGQAGKH